jgi:hypothetical protein
MAPMSVRYVYWQDGDAWLGYLEDYPDYMTQGETREDLEEHLRAIYVDLTSGVLEKDMNIERRHVGELQLV